MRTWIALFLLGFSFWLSGCKSQPQRHVVPVAQIPPEIAAEFQQSVEGWNAGNLAGFIAIYAESATLATPDGFVLGRAAIRDHYAPNFQPGATRVELSFERLDIEVISPDAAIVRGIYRNTENGQVIRRGPTTLLMRHVLGHWRIFHDHSS